MKYELLRSYLLGQATAQEAEEIESRAMIEKDFAEKVIIAEDEMIEEYLDGELTAVEEIWFRTHFLNKQRIVSLNVIFCLKQYARQYARTEDHA